MKRNLTRVAITLIALNAALAVVILALGRMGDTEGRILGTSLLATISALLAMVQIPALREKRLSVMPPIGIAAGAAGFLIAAVDIWATIDTDSWWRLGSSAYTIAVAGAVAAILSGWAIRGRDAWLGTAAPVLIIVAAAMILGGIWFEIDNEAYWRTFGVLAVLVAAAGLAIPILHRSSVDDVHLTIEHCPFCGMQVRGETETRLACSACAQEFRVLVDA